MREILGDKIEYSKAVLAIIILTLG